VAQGRRDPTGWRLRWPLARDMSGGQFQHAGVDAALMPVDSKSLMSGYQHAYLRRRSSRIAGERDNQAADPEAVA
jgi:hypothetical protein